MIKPIHPARRSRTPPDAGRQPVSWRLALFIWLMLLGSAQPVARAGEGLELQKITDSVYAIIGELGNRSATNLGNNATFGFVVTSAGVVLIDSGGSYRGARQIHQVIQTVTDKPVVTVINTGGQDHRWLGNDYFRSQGAEIIASEAAVADQKARLQDQLIRLDSLVGSEGLQGTKPVYAERKFAQSMIFELGGNRFELYHRGQAHTPGDSFVWLPEQRIVFSGDIVYVERMLGIGTQSNSKSWLAVYEAMAALEPVHLIPGHGRATDMAHAGRDTYDYLVFLREAVEQFMDDGGDMSDIGSVDQSRFDYLQNYATIAGRNAQQVYTELEWE